MIHKTIGKDREGRHTGLNPYNFMQNMIRFIVVNTIIYIFPKKPIYHSYMTITVSSLDMETCLKLINLLSHIS